MAFRRVGAAGELREGEMLDVDLGDERRVVVCNVGGMLYAMDGVCPHRQGPLGQGALHGTMVVCPWHAWEFDCTTGEHDYNRTLKLRLYPVKVDGDDILVDVD
jgi:nitrite reductase/ring-hydroxylating ferredoxin subunit